MSAGSGQESARYDYDHFGNPLRATGPAARANSLRFSTQFADDITSRVKYLYRDYDAGVGRWLGRDPIEEPGGENLFAFVRNEPTIVIDSTGQYATRFATLPSGDGGRTTFNPTITNITVLVFGCCCKLDTATWAANTVVELNSFPSPPCPNAAAHEDVHAHSDDLLAAKALPVAITYLKSHCAKKGWFSSWWTGSSTWTTSECETRMKSEAAAASSYIQSQAYGMLTSRAHSDIGANDPSFTPAGASKFNTWFTGWLSGKYNGGKYW